MKKLSLALLALIPIIVLARDVRFRWHPYPVSEYVSRYYLYKNGQRLISTPDTSVTAPADTGDVMTITAENTAGESDPSEPLVVQPKAPSIVVESFSSQEIVREAAPASFAVDGIESTFWHCDWFALPPHSITIRLSEEVEAVAIRYLPRQDDSPNGRITNFTVDTSIDGVEWRPASTGVWPNDGSWKEAGIERQRLRYFRISTPDQWATAAELRVVLPPVDVKTMRIYWQWSTDLSDWKSATPVVLPDNQKLFFRHRVERAGGTAINIPTN